MPYKKYIRKTARKGLKFAKKRYSTRTGGVRVARIARDVMNIKRSLNVEHKHIDYKIGSAGSIVAQAPTKQSPVVLALSTPIKGTGYNDRIGNQLRVVHMTAKYQFTFHNNSDLVQRQNVRARIIFAKNASDVPVIANLLEPDANGHYTDQSFINTQEYKKYLWMKALDTRQSYTQPTNRFPLSDGGGDTLNPAQTGSTTLNVQTPGGSLNIANFYKRAESKTSVRMYFENGTNNVEQMKPYLILTSDVIEHATLDDYDYVNVSAVIRMTYVDN